MAVPLLWVLTTSNLVFGLFSGCIGGRTIKRDSIIALKAPEK
jgi:hypothetical protein